MGGGRAGRIADAFYALALLVVSGLVWRDAARLPPAPFDPLGPKTFPLWIAGALALLALVMLARLALGRDLGRARQAMVLGLGGEEGGGHARRPVVALALFGLSLAYAALLGFRGFGFLPATILYVFAAGALLGGLGRRRLLPLAILAVAVAVAADLVFRRLFGLDLP